MYITNYPIYSHHFNCVVRGSLILQRHEWAQLQAEMKKQFGEWEYNIINERIGLPTAVTTRYGATWGNVLGVRASDLAYKLFKTPETEKKYRRQNYVILVLN